MEDDQRVIGGRLDRLVEPDTGCQGSAFEVDDVAQAPGGAAGFQELVESDI